MQKYVNVGGKKFLSVCCRAFGMVCSSEARCVGLLGWYAAQRLDVFDFPLFFSTCQIQDQLQMEVAYHLHGAKEL